MKKLMMTLSIALMCVASVMAQDGKGCPMRGGEGRSGQRVSKTEIAKQRTERMATELSLTEVQKEQIYGLNLQREEYGEKHRAERQAFEKQQREARMSEREAVDKQMRNILTVEQYKVWSERVAAHRPDGFAKGHSHGKMQGKQCCCCKCSGKGQGAHRRS